VCSRIRWQLAQCEDYLRKMRQQIPSLEVVACLRHGRCSEDGGEEWPHDEAAIASKSAAQVFRRDILASGIESKPAELHPLLHHGRRPDRVARIPVLATQRNARPAWCFASPIGQDRCTPRSTLSAAEQVDLTKIRVAPHRRPTLEYSFYLDFIGDRNDANVAPRAGRPGRRRRKRAHLRFVS